MTLKMATNALLRCSFPALSLHPAGCKLCWSLSLLYGNQVRKNNLGAPGRGWIGEFNGTVMKIGPVERDTALSLKGLSIWWEMDRAGLSGAPWDTKWVPLQGAWLGPTRSFLLYAEILLLNPAPGQPLILRLSHLPGRPQVFNWLKRKASLILKRRALKLPGDLMQLSLLGLTGWNEQDSEGSVGAFIQNKPVTFSPAISRLGLFTEEIYDASCSRVKCIKKKQNTGSLSFQIVSNDFQFSHYLERFCFCFLFLLLIHFEPLLLNFHSVPLRTVPLLVCWGCHNKVLQTGWHTQQKFIVSGLEARSPRSKSQQGWVLLWTVREDLFQVICWQSLAFLGL